MRKIFRKPAVYNRFTRDTGYDCRYICVKTGKYRGNIVKWGDQYSNVRCPPLKESRNRNYFTLVLRLRREFHSNNKK